MSVVRFPKRVPLSIVPTQIHHLPRLTRLLGGPEIFMKRDDLTGCAMTGNKVRKLEFLCAEAIRRGATTLMTCGGVQSNHARTTAVAAARLGMKSILFLRGQCPQTTQGNLLLDRLVGSEIRFITTEQYKQADQLMKEEASRLKSIGEIGYAIPEGGSNALGCWGYVNAAKEIQKQESKLDKPFDYIVVAVGSGGTFGGLVAGRKMLGLRAEIIGFNVCDTAADFQQRVAGELAIFQQRWNHPVSCNPSELNIVDGYVGEGYGRDYPEELDAIQLLATVEGIVLEPVYTGKAFHGLLDQIRKGRFKKTDRILFCHTGGIFGLLDGQQRFHFRDQNQSI